MLPSGPSPALSVSRNRSRSRITRASRMSWTSIGSASGRRWRTGGVSPAEDFGGLMRLGKHDSGAGGFRALTVAPNHRVRGGACRSCRPSIQDRLIDPEVGVCHHLRVKVPFYVPAAGPRIDLIYTSHCGDHLVHAADEETANPLP